MLIEYSYEHIIVGTRKSSAEPETFGGILADEMGLGKTLTVLSAIVGSLARSRAILPSSPLQIHKCETSAGGTLIIVPSVRKLLANFQLTHKGINVVSSCYR